MRTIFVVFFYIIIAFTNVTGQDVLEEQNIQVTIPRLPPDLTFHEFTQMQRDLNWKQIFAASIIPGYIHFYASQKKCLEYRRYQDIGVRNDWLFYY